MKILITGGNGCLGYNLSNYLLKKGNKICSLDNYETSEAKDVIKNKNLLTIRGSISDNFVLKEVFKKFNPTHVIHCAASYKDPLDFNKDIETNIDDPIV